jgi:phospholipase C
LENRPFDHVFGWRDGVNGLTGEEYNDVFIREGDNSNNSSSINDRNSDGGQEEEQKQQRVYVDSECPFINSCDPSHDTSATTYKLFGGQDSSSTEASNSGFVSYEKSNPNFCNVMSGFKTSDLPVINALADEFAVMDRFFASHPGPTWPNRMFALSATSAGSTETYYWYRGVDGALFPQKTIFDQIEEEHLTWRNYYNDTPWELFMEKIADSPDELQPIDQFYRDAREGTLPAFAWINPRSGINITTGVGSNDQLPDQYVEFN